MKSPGLIGRLMALVAGLTALGLFLGPTPLGVADIVASLVGFGSPAAEAIVWEIRLPRLVAAFCVGAALGMSGAALQAMLRNPLAEPGVLGVTAGATLFATLSLYYGLATLFFLAVPLAAVTGALVVTGGLVILGHRISSITTLILIGVGINAFAGAMMSLLLNLAPNPFTLSDLVNWTLGSVAYRGWSDVATCAPVMVLGGVILWTSRRGLSALTLGEATAGGIGLDLPVFRRRIILGTSLAAGASVALAGAVGFVGIVAPHIVRPWVGYDPARTLIPSALLGGGFLIAADILIRLLPSSSELGLGVVAALVGAPFFVSIAARRGRRAP